VEGFQTRPFGCGVGSQFHHEPRFPRPPYDPGRSDFPSPVLTLACPAAACPPPRKLKRWLVYAPLGCGLHATLVPSLRVRSIPAQCPGAPRDRQVPRAPLHASGVTRRVAASWATSAGITPPSSLIRTHAPNQIPLAAYGRCLGRRVCAGCRQSLLGDGPSRRYLCRSFLGCLDPYRGGSSRCTFPFLPSMTSAFPACQPGRLSRNIRSSDFPSGLVFAAAAIH
jgi:hypothetical protein